MGNVYFWRKLHSLSGIIPLSLFLLEHIFTNSMALGGPENFNRAVGLLHSIPYLWLWELLFILLPLAFHGVYGIVILLQSNNNVLNYSYYRNWMFYLQRVTAVITIIFVTWHVLSLRFGLLGDGTAITFASMTELFANPLYFIFYLIGFIAATIHLTNGFSTFLISWGVTIGERSQKFTVIVSWILLVVFILIGVGFMLAFIA